MGDLEMAKNTSRIPEHVRQRRVGAAGRCFGSVARESEPGQPRLDMTAMVLAAEEGRDDANSPRIFVRDETEYRPLLRHLTQKYYQVASASIFSRKNLPVFPASSTHAYNAMVPSRIHRQACRRGGAGADARGKTQSPGVRVRERIAASEELLAWAFAHRNVRRQVKHCRPSKPVGNRVDKAAQDPSGEASGRADVVHFKAIRLRA